MEQYNNVESRLIVVRDNLKKLYKDICLDPYQYGEYQDEIRKVVGMSFSSVCSNFNKLMI